MEARDRLNFMRWEQDRQAPRRARAPASRENDRRIRIALQNLRESQKTNEDVQTFLRQMAYTGFDVQLPPPREASLGSGEVIVH